MCVSVEVAVSLRVGIRLREQTTTPLLVVGFALCSEWEKSSQAFRSKKNNVRS